MALNKSNILLGTDGKSLTSDPYTWFELTMNSFSVSGTTLGNDALIETSDLKILHLDGSVSDANQLVSFQGPTEYTGSTYVNYTIELDSYYEITPYAFDELYIRMKIDGYYNIPERQEYFLLTYRDDGDEDPMWSTYTWEQFGADSILSKHKNQNILIGLLLEEKP